MQFVASDFYFPLRVNRRPDQVLSIEQILKPTIPAAMPASLTTGCLGRCEVLRSASARQSIIQRSLKKLSYVVVSLPILFGTLRTIWSGWIGLSHHLVLPHFQVIRPRLVGTLEVPQLGKRCIPI